MIYLLAKNPEVQDRLYDDILKVTDDFESIDHESINDMTLLEATIMETLRLKPAIAESNRVCTKSCLVNGLKIPKNTRIQMPNYPAHLNEDYFPEPEVFKPERFLKENSDQIIPYTWRPFGVGVRECIGKRFAMTVIMMFMAKFIGKFKIIEIPETKTEYPNGDLFMLVYPKMQVKLESRKSK